MAQRRSILRAPSDRHALVFGSAGFCARCGVQACLDAGMGPCMGHGAASIPEHGSTDHRSSYFVCPKCVSAGAECALLNLCEWIKIEESRLKNKIERRCLFQRVFTLCYCTVLKYTLLPPFS